MELKTLVKNNKIVFYIYYYVMSLLVNILKIFVKPERELILFVSYGGRFFNDSPKCIYEEMLKDKRFKGYKLVWAFENPNNFNLKTPMVRINTFAYFKTALKASCWVTNTVVERGLNFKGKNTFYLHTTHTALPKLMGHDDIDSGSFALPCEFKYSCSCAQSEEEARMQKSMFHLKEEQVLVSGYPKNDILCNVSESTRLELRQKLGIPNDKKAILYAPTYRDIKFGTMKCPINFKKWEKILGEDYIILFRAHPVVANETVLDTSTGFMIDVSSYQDNTDIIIASDILISDYSGIFFEYGIQEKPMFCFAYDYEDYIKSRALYFDIRDLIPGGHLDEEHLLTFVKEHSDDYGVNLQLQIFKEKYISTYGNATQICVDKIFNSIKDNLS